MLAPTERAPDSLPSPLPLPSAFLAAELGPVVMADDPCEAASSGVDPTGPRNYYRARYYDPKIGRFISEDPIRFAGGENFYAYAENSPATLVDPLGLLPGSTLGGDDPAFKNPKKFIEELEKQLRDDPDLTPRQIEKIKRRLKELRRRPSDRQQHHMEQVPFCERHPSMCAPVNACNAHPVECAEIVAGVILACVVPEAEFIWLFP